MSMAQPGTVTGTFHIILGNIPKRRKGYELENFVASSGIPVVQAVVHQGLGCGWVSVKGQQAFFDLGNWLQKVQWDGKSLQVDLRNFDLETPLGPSSPPTARPRESTVGTSRNGSIDMTYAQAYQPVQAVATSYTTSPPLSAYATPASPQQYSYQPVQSVTYAPVQQAQYASAPRINQVLVSPTYQFPLSPSYSFPSPPVGLANSQSSSATTYNGSSQSSSATSIQSKARLVHFSRVTGAYSVSEIRALVTSVCPRGSVDPIVRVEIPKYSDGKSKGHALILMQTESLADRVVRKLHNTTVKGNKLKVKIAKEGAKGYGEYDNGSGSLSGQMEAMSLRGGSFSSGTGESSTQGTSYATTESGQAVSEALSDTTDPSVQENGTGRRRSSLPIANGSFSIPGASGFMSNAAPPDEKQYSNSHKKASEKERGYKESSSGKNGHSKEKRSNGTSHSGKSSSREKDKKSRK